MIASDAAPSLCAGLREADRYSARRAGMRSTCLVRELKPMQAAMPGSRQPAPLPEAGSGSASEPRGRPSTSKTSRGRAELRTRGSLSGRTPSWLSQRIRSSCAFQRGSLAAQKNSHSAGVTKLCCRSLADELHAPVGEGIVQWSLFCDSGSPFSTSRAPAQHIESASFVSPS